MVDSRGTEQLWRWAFSAIIALLLATLGCTIAFGPTAHAAAAWETEWERALKAAEQKGELTYYSLGAVGFVGEFEKRFPRIKVRVVQGKGNELLVRIMTERRAGRFLADMARIGNTLLRFDISKNDLKPMARRKEGARYMVTWKTEWMNSEPMQKIVNQARAKT